MVCGLPASSVTVIVTTVPSGSPVTVPEIVGVVSLVSPTGFTEKVGAVVSITPVVVAEASLPAASMAVAVIVNSPSAIGAVAPTCQDPSSTTTAIRVCESPFESVTNTVIELPGSTSVVVPLNTGVESLESVKSFTLIVGAVKSIVPVCESCALLPALSLTFATTLNSPSANACGTSILHVPSPFIAVINCCSVPALSVTITVTTLPAAKPCVEPLIVGVVSFVSSILAIVTVGAVRSMVPVTVAVLLLPASSFTLAVTVKSPSLSSLSISAL
ncbi:hypothetical protein AN393_03745 [Pseudoalteromonas sp. P1-25]|nr:hypothetical protein AN393_03745 [Pseudoalteromonas sp. P1-25]